MYEKMNMTAAHRRANLLAEAGSRDDAHAILPTGTNLDLKNPESNEYYRDWLDPKSPGTYEVWKKQAGGMFIVRTAGAEPIGSVGASQLFRHDQTDKKLFGGPAEMVGWFNDAGQKDGTVPASGKISLYTYK